MSVAASSKNLPGVLLGGVVGYRFAISGLLNSFEILCVTIILVRNMWKCKLIPVEQNILFKGTKNIFCESFMICPFEMMVEWSSKRSTLFCPLHRIWSRKNFLGRATISICVYTVHTICLDFMFGRNCLFQGENLCIYVPQCDHCINIHIAVKVRTNHQNLSATSIWLVHLG